MSQRLRSDSGKKLAKMAGLAYSPSIAAFTNVSNDGGRPNPNASFAVLQVIMFASWLAATN